MSWLILLPRAETPLMEEEAMSLVAVVVGIVIGLVQPLRRAVAAAVATWALTTAFLAFVAGSSGGGDSQSHRLTAGFWLLQVVLLLVALAATWAASRLRSRRVVEPSRRRVRHAEH